MLISLVGPGERGKAPDPPLRSSAVQKSNCRLVSLARARVTYLALELD
jgi:hypothetical protein